MSLGAVVIDDLDCELRVLQRALSFAYIQSSSADEGFASKNACDVVMESSLTRMLRESLEIVESLLDVVDSDDDPRV